MFPAVQSLEVRSLKAVTLVGWEWGSGVGSVRSVDVEGLWSHIAGKAVAREGRTTPPEHGSDALRRGNKEGVAV